MNGNCVVIVSKDEGLNPISIAKKALESKRVDKVVISDVSNEKTFKALKERETPRIEVIRRGEGYEGKGGGVVLGGRIAIEEGFENVCYVDGDLLAPDVRWFKLLFNGLQQADLVKASFIRCPRDAQITRHITRPLISMFFPKIWKLNQPLGGELCVKKEVLENLFFKGIKPPGGWGIDTFITTKTCALGYKIGEVYLGEKLHKKKTLAQLENMFYECLVEMIRMIKKYGGTEKGSFVRLQSPFKKELVQTEQYMNLRKEVEQAFREFAYFDGLNTPYEDLFEQAMKSKNFDSFFESTKEINRDVWVEVDHWIARYFNNEHLKDYYLLWKVRALAFCLHEANNFEEAERNTELQARKALEYGKSIQRSLVRSHPSSSL